MGGRMFKCYRLNVHRDLEFCWGWSGQLQNSDRSYYWVQLCTSYHSLSSPEPKWKTEKKLPESLSIHISCYPHLHLICSRDTDLAPLSSIHQDPVSTTGPLHILLGIFTPVCPGDRPFLTLQHSAYVLPPSLITWCKFLFPYPTCSLSVCLLAF